MKVELADLSENLRIVEIKTDIATVVTCWTQAQIDCGAEALRQFEQGGRLLRSWDALPNSDKRKWREKADVVLRAALGS